MVGLFHLILKRRLCGDLLLLWLFYVSTVRYVAKEKLSRLFLLVKPAF